MLEGQAYSVKRINLLYDDVEEHWHVITKLTAATARRYVCKHATNHVQVTSRSLRPDV